MADDEKAALYKQLVEQADPWLVLERMRELGFWPEDDDAPEEGPAASKERAKLEDELERLRYQGSTVADPDAALQKERIRRWQGSKKRRAIARAQRAAQQEKRAAAWATWRKSSVVHGGEGVSGGLDEFEGKPDRVASAGLPVIERPEDLAKAIGIELRQLRWLTFHRRAVTLVHYHRYSIPKKTGGQRQISAPKPALSHAQQWVRQNIVDRVELAGDAHGFVRHRSTVTNASPHVGKQVVVNLDLKDFFPSVGFRRVKGLFTSLGYAESVATVLALLCTEPPRVEAELDGKVYQVALGDRVLPQGACTSPAITNCICRKLDRRLRALGGKLGFTYTRYADDLTFSGDAATQVGKLLGMVRRVINQEGFVENADKTRVMRQGRCQEVTGLTVNDKVGISRRERRRLRAILHNVAKNGLKAENRAEHPKFAAYLRGLVAYAQSVDPDHAQDWRAALARALS